LNGPPILQIKEWLSVNYWKWLSVFPQLLPPWNLGQRAARGLGISKPLVGRIIPSDTCSVQLTDYVVLPLNFPSRPSSSTGRRKYGEYGFAPHPCTTMINHLRLGWPLGPLLVPSDIPFLKGVGYGM